MLAQLGGEDARLAANSLASAQVWLATIVGPAVAGVLLTRIAPAWLLGFDAATFAFLGAQAWRTHTDAAAMEQPVDARAAESGFRLLRRNDLLGLIALTWLFFFLYGPVEAALPVYVAHDLHAHAGLLGAYWTSFGVGAVVSTLLVGTLRSRATRRITLLIVAGWALAWSRSPSRRPPPLSSASPSGPHLRPVHSPYVRALSVDYHNRGPAKCFRRPQRRSHRRRSPRHGNWRPDCREPWRPGDAERFWRRNRSPRRPGNSRLATKPSCRHAPPPEQIAARFDALPRDLPTPRAPGRPP